MGKGSQLLQLKSALAHAGVTGQKSSGKKRKRSAVPVEKERQKTAAKLGEIHRRLNPFDEKVTKLKHDVGGRKLKGVIGKPAKSKQAGLEQRKKLLLKEWEEKNRAGGILDRRFGENDPTMSLEERMLERFTRERQRTSTSAAFNLEDEDELTHYGQSLSKLDDFDGIGLRSDSEDEDEVKGQLDREFVSSAHFGGFDEGAEDDPDSEEPPRKKSKAEVMAEVMAKSKEHKLRRQMEKEQEENVRFELDNQFSELRELLFASKPIPTPESAPPGETNAPTKDPDAAILALVPETQDESYDQRVRELAFDKRAKPKDRTKTEEELALEAKEALEKAERRRQKRMQGFPESDSEDEGRAKGKRKRGGDDLEDDFYEEDVEWQGLGSGLQVKDVASEDEEDSDAGSQEEAGEEDDEEEDEEGEDDSSESDVNSETEDVGEEGNHEELVKSGKKNKGKEKATSRSADEIPYTFPCPEHHDEFLEIMESIDDKHTSTVVQRIRALYHTSLSPDNKFKLQTFGCVLIDHILYSASIDPPKLDVITAIYPHLNILTKAYPIPIARYFNEKLALMHKNLKRGLSQGAHKSDSRTWPRLGELSLLRVIGQMWPTSDLHHAVISPTRVLLGAYLGLCRVRTLSDLASGLFLCTIWLQYENLSKRLVPEAITFLVNTVLHLAPHRIQDVGSLPGCFPSPDFGSTNLTLKKSKHPLTPQTPNLTALLSLQNNSDEQAKTDLLSLAITLLSRFADMYKGLDGFLELFEPIRVIMESIERKRLHDSIQTQLTKTLDVMARLLKFARESRQPLRLQAHKPIPIATYVPKFDSTTSNYLRQRDPDQERNEAAKLRNQVKQERKGAIRELRKDARFLASVEQQKQIEKDRAYNDRMKRVISSIEPERAEQKAAEKAKAKEKRRAGRT